jgi:hypothetical protein
MSDWEQWADDDKQLEEEDVNKKFENEEVIDKDKEERERKERAEAKKLEKEEIKKNQQEKKKEEKDYDKLFNEKFEKAGAVKPLSREEIIKENPNLSEAQIDELVSRQSETGITDNLFDNDGEETPKSLGVTVENLKGEKAYKEFGKKVAEYMIEKGQSHNHIPKFFGELFHALSDKITVTKMRNIVNDFDSRLKLKLEEEEKKKREDMKLEKKAKTNKKTKLAGVTKALDTEKMLMSDMFVENAQGEGEYDDYGDEGDGYVDYGRDDLDFM